MSVLRSALDAVVEVHPVLEPASRRTRIRGGEDEPRPGQYAPHRIPTREGERILRETHEVAELLAVGAREQPAPPQLEQDHGGGTSVPPSAGPTSSPWRYARCMSSMSASRPRSWRMRERSMRTLFGSMKSSRR